MIDIKKLTFAYDAANYIFDQTDITFNKNITTIVLGKNGTGKTTLFHLIAGILTPDFGEINNEVDVILIPDQPVLYDHLTGYEYLEYIKILSNHKLEDKIIDVVALLEMKTHMSKLIHEMSLGMKHKLALLSAMLLNYDTYMIDEPLTALDPPSQKEMIKYFNMLKEQGKTLIISTHMIHIAYQLADEVVILNGQEVIKIKNDFSDYQAFEDEVIKHFQID
jgi:ABC-2 type transport system ATP-binding protein